MIYSGLLNPNYISISMENIRGKKAIVLGGTSGIGLATARALLEAGAEVVVGSRSGTNTDKTRGMAVLQVDVLDREGLALFFSQQAPFDFLVNSATGGARAIGPFLEMDLDGFQGSFAKLWGYTNSVRIGAQYLAEDGAIVLVSGSPARKCKPGYIAISTVGNAVEGFVRGVAPELAPRRINVVSPGLIDTPMFAHDGDERKSFFDSATAGNLIPRAGTPEEIAQAILFLLGNNFVTGTTVDVDGGALLA
jgi:NAD(P)-dependent dehydrogenase (short-subunit alcohol dehydrogenase family)